MSTIATIFAVLIVVLILLVIGNLVFSFIAERRNPPLGKFIECDGVRVHYREWGDATARARFFSTAMELQVFFRFRSRFVLNS